MDLQPYNRPTLTQEDFKEVSVLAQKLSMLAHLPTKLREAFETILIENSRLAKECNEHRAARGFEPLPVTKV